VTVWAVPARLLLDLTWWASIGPLSVPQLGSVAIAGGLAWVVARGWASARTHPLAIPLALFTGTLVLGALRATPWDAARYGLHLFTPVLWLLALHARPVGEVPKAWWWAAAIPVALSLGALLAGQPADHVLHDWPRLIGAYGNLHTHAAVMAAVAATALPWAALTRERLPALVGAGALACLALTWVRGGWLWVGLAIVLVLLARRRVGGAAVAIGVAGALVAGVGVVRERWSDLVAIATGTPPPGGWGALGSWRVRIWTEAWTAWGSGSWADVLLGRGLGGQYGLYRYLDPHSDWLSLLFQLGPLGVVAWGAVVVGALRILWRSSAEDPRAAVAFGVLGASIAVAAVGNDFATRPTAVLWTFGWVGLALTGSSPPPDGSDGRSAPPAA
jgi:hypothetical protein